MTSNFNKEHRQARKKVELVIGRKLNHLECVHHIDGNPTNNQISNLRIVSRQEHSSLHFAGKRKGKTKALPFLESNVCGFMGLEYENKRDLRKKLFEGLEKVPLEVNMRDISSGK